MPDLLTHVLVAYVTGTVLVWNVDRLPRRLVPVAMVGAVLPDLVKVHLVLSGGTVGSLLGVPFSWQPIHRLGGVLVLAGVGALTFDRSYRRATFATLLAGAGSHLFLDSLIRRANGFTPPYLYPLTWWHPPSGDLYLSSDPWPAVLALTAAAIVFAYGRVGRP